MHNGIKLLYCMHNHNIIGYIKHAVEAEVVGEFSRQLASISADDLQTLPEGESISDQVSKGAGFAVLTSCTLSS